MDQMWLLDMGREESRMTEVFSDCIDRKETGGRKGVKKRMNMELETSQPRKGPEERSQFLNSLRWASANPKQVSQRTTHSSILAWRMSWTEEPGGLQSIGLHRVRHD